MSLSVSVEQKILSDLAFLKTAKSQNFQDIGCKKIQDLLINKIDYKKNIKTEQEKKLYRFFKTQLYEVCELKVPPLRIVDVVKKKLKQNEDFSQSLSEALKRAHVNINALKCLKGKQERKTELRKLEETLINMSLENEEYLKCVESIHWVHGTNSAILPMLPYTAYTMLCTGELLNDKGLAPMCGELSQGGLCLNGISQVCLSAETVRNLSRSWDYAKNISNSFNPKKFDNADLFFTDILDRFKKTSAYDNLWDEYIIILLQFKQWLPERFCELQQKYANKIDDIIKASTKLLFYKEAMVLEAIQYPEEELKKAINDESKRKEMYEKLCVEKKCFADVWLYSTECDAAYIFNYLENIPSNCSIGLCGLCTDIVFHGLLSNIIKLKLFSNEYLRDLRNDKGPYQSWNNARAEELTKRFGDPLDVNLYLQTHVKTEVEKHIRFKQFHNVNQGLIRLKDIFEKPVHVKFSEEEKSMISSPFPILLGSTKTKSFFLDKDEDEVNINSAILGDEIDMIFVQDKDVFAMINWLEKHKLEHKICVHGVKNSSPLFSIALYHAPNDVICKNNILSFDDYNFTNQQILKLLPLYQNPFPNGSLREYHGVAHATRAAFFSVVITNMYLDLAQEYSLTTHPKNIPVAVFVHDAARKSDYGEDLWDEESGQICKDFMIDKVNLDPLQAQILSEGISKKDNKSSISLEQKIIHDADCIEIIRCISDSRYFKSEKLWMFQDKMPKPWLNLFINNAESLITLTEKSPIKEFLQNSPDPLRSLIEIINFAKRFHFLSNYFPMQKIISSSDYRLPEGIKLAIESLNNS